MPRRQEKRSTPPPPEALNPKPSPAPPHSKLRSRENESLPEASWLQAEPPIPLLIEPASMGFRVLGGSPLKSTAQCCPSDLKRSDELIMLYSWIFVKALPIGSTVVPFLWFIFRILW